MEELVCEMLMLKIHVLKLMVIEVYIHFYGA